MTISRVGELFRTGKDILRQDGLICLVKRASLFLVRLLFSCQIYYIYEKTINETNENKFIPKMQDFTLNIISNPDQVKELKAKGFDINLDIGAEEAKRRLNEGAILFCVFLGLELAHTSWVAITSKAKMDPLPLAIDYQNEAYIENCVTVPQYRGLGLYPYTLCQLLQFLRAKDKTKAKIATLKANTSSIRGITKAGFEIWGSKRLFKILLWKFWKEKQIKYVKH